VKSGWQRSTLGEVSDLLSRGISPKYVDDGGVCVLNQKCVRDHRVGYEQARRHDTQAKSVNTERFVQVGDVLVNSTGTGTLGRVAQVRETPPEPTTVDSHVTIVRPKPGKFFLDFFGYMLVAIEEAIKEAGEGCGGQTELARSVLAEKFFVNYPTSLPEQQRIVGILDEAFDCIATAKANTEKNLQNARALFESHLQAVFSQSDKGWELVRIEDACESIMDCVNKTAEKVDEVTPYKMIRTPNVRNGRVNLESVYYVTEDVYRIWTRRQVPRRGDVILTREAPMGEVGMLLSDEKVFLGQRLVSYRANPTKLNNQFLLYALRSGPLQSQIHAFASGSTVQHMRVPDTKNLRLPLPRLAVQEDVVATLNTLHEETQRLESLYQRKLAALDELKKSLLHQAFSGAL
jgi:type I restriction enzyme, S subunit